MTTPIDVNVSAWTVQSSSPTLDGNYPNTTRDDNPYLPPNIWTHVKTFGYDYVRFIANQTFLDNLAEIATKHDWVIGAVTEWEPNNVNYSDSVTYNTIKGANTSTGIMKYTAYHSMFAANITWMESWCTDNALDPEDLYYHAYYDTTIRIGGSYSNPTTVLVPGWGGGSAANITESRMLCRWNGGTPSICPSSTTWRSAFQAMSLAMCEVQDNPGVFIDGLFLDSFSGVINRNDWHSHLENTIELRSVGTEAQVYAQAETDLTNAYSALESYMQTQTGNANFRVTANAAHIDNLYNYYNDMFNITHTSAYNDLAIEFAFSSVTNTNFLPRFVSTYDDLEAGRKIFIRAETRISTSSYPASDSIDYRQYLLAGNYLLNHPNANMMYHAGGAANYGGDPYGTVIDTHWHDNLEIDLGDPVERVSNDYWGTPNTDRFFTFASDTGYTVLGREYDNAIILCKIPVSGGAASIGTNSISHALGATYYRLLENNTTDTAITSLDLGYLEGAILMKAAI